MRMRTLIVSAALPISLVLSGCETAPMKDVQRMFGSMLPSSDANKTAEPRTIPPQVIVAPDPEPQRQAIAPAAPVSRGAADLQLGVSKYENGEYADASK